MHRTPISIMPYMAHTTLAILALYLSISLFRWRLDIRQHQIAAHSIICLACAVLLRQDTPRELWAFCLALGYIVWNALPGSFDYDLPSHAAFMRSLHVQNQLGDCIICWDARILADLPCKHRSCKDCLQLMGEYGQTACPLCRKPLFGALDWPVLVIMKTLVASMAIHNALCLLNAQYELRQGFIGYTLVWMAALSITAGSLWYVVVAVVMPNEENWWRIAPGGLSLATVCGSLAYSVSIIGLKLWLDEGTFT